MLGQFPDGEAHFGFGAVQAQHAELLEVGGDRVLGPLGLADPAAQVVVDLLHGVIKIHPEAFGLADGHTGHEEVDPSSPACGGAGGVLLEQVDAFGDDPEAPQQPGPELLRIPPLGRGLALGAPLDDAFSPTGSEVLEVGNDLGATELIL